MITDRIEGKQYGPNHNGVTVCAKGEMVKNATHMAHGRMIKRGRLMSALPLVLILCCGFAYSQDGHWYKKVLITNDDGISDKNMQALARAFSKVAKTVIIAPLANCSGSSEYTSFWQRKELRVVRSKLDEHIDVYGVDGYPGDCMLLAFRGILKDDPPDLVISGINGGANLGDDWLWSGTVGAVRTAAVWGGKPAIAVSGIIEENLDAAIEWIIRLSSSTFVRNMKTGHYLVVNLPRVPYANIKGVAVAKPTRLLNEYTLDNFGSKDPEIWRYGGYPRRVTPDPESDVTYYNQNYIVIAPMTVDETDEETLRVLQINPGSIPAWDEAKGGEKH
jgi:5'-nucleotidase